MRSGCVVMIRCTKTLEFGCRFNCGCGGFASPMYDHDPPNASATFCGFTSVNINGLCLDVYVNIVLCNLFRYCLSSRDRKMLVEIRCCLAQLQEAKCRFTRGSGVVKARPCGDRTATIDQFVHYLGHSHMCRLWKTFCLYHILNPTQLETTCYP